LIERIVEMLTISPNGKLFVLGDDCCTGGLYVLRIAVAKNFAPVLRRTKVPKRVKIAAGQYSYVGSAFGRGFPLARRLIRHGTRSGEKPPHAIRASMESYFIQIGMGVGTLLLKNGKPPRSYNVDPLLDEMFVMLIAAYAIRLPDPGMTELHRMVEGQLGRMLMDDPVTVVFESGLGAQDYKKREKGQARQTHLLRVAADESWWKCLPAKLEDLVDTLLKSGSRDLAFEQLP